MRGATLCVGWLKTQRIKLMWVFPDFGVMVCPIKTDQTDYTVWYCEMSWQGHVLGVLPGYGLDGRVESEAFLDAHGGERKVG